MIKTILKTRLTSGFVFRVRGGVVVRKETGNYVAGFKAFKIDKRADGWIEIRDAQSWELWALVRRFEALGYGALYLGFAFRRTFAYFRPYKKIRSLEVVGQGVREINEAFPFLKLEWTLKGGSLLGSRFHFRVQVVDLFRFVRFLSPLPPDIDQMVPKVVFPKFVVQRLVSDVFRLPSLVLLNGRLIYRVVLSWVRGYVLRVKRVVLVEDAERGRYEVLGGYVSPCADLSVVSGIIEVGGSGNVRSGKTIPSLGGGWGP